MSAPKLAYRLDEAAKEVGLSKATLYRAIRKGELEMGKIHNRSVIRGEILMAWFERQYEAVKKSAA